MKRVISILGVGGLMEAIRAYDRLIVANLYRQPQSPRFYTGWVIRVTLARHRRRLLHPYEQTSLLQLDISQRC
jgi:hypothetical protein